MRSKLVSGRGKVRVAIGGAALAALALFMLRPTIAPAGGGGEGHTFQGNAPSEGKAYAEALGLKTLRTGADIEKCEGGVVEAQGEIYCIPTSIAPTDTDQWVVAMRVRGSSPTDAAIAAYDAQMKYIHAVDSDASDKVVEELRLAAEAAAEAASD